MIFSMNFEVPLNLEKDTNLGGFEVLNWPHFCGTGDASLRTPDVLM